MPDFLPIVNGVVQKKLRIAIFYHYDKCLLFSQ